MLSPSCYYGWRSFSSEILLIETLASFTEQRGQWEKHIKIHAFPVQEGGGKHIWNIKPEISNLPEETTFIAGESGHLHFWTSSLHSYMRNEGEDLSDMWISANDQSNLTKIPIQAGGAHWSAVEVTDKFNQTFNSPSLFVHWQNERVKSCANLQYSVFSPYTYFIS
jgi:hypothetical protein